MNLQLMIEFRHFELASGILTNDQYVRLQDASRFHPAVGYVEPSTQVVVQFSPDQLDALVEAARRLGNSPQLVAWLPEGRGMQQDLKDTHESRLARATALLAILRSLDH